MAKRGAHQIITSLGMDVDISFAEEFHFQFNLTNTKIPQGDKEINHEIIDNFNTEEVDTRFRGFDFKISPFTLATDYTGMTTVVRKSSICWLLNQNPNQVSSDRLLRTRQSEYKSQKFPHFQASQSGYSKEYECLQIQILKRKAKKAREYTSNYNNIKRNTKEVGVLCQWFGVTRCKYLTLINDFANGYIRMKNYEVTIISPLIF